MAEGSQKFHSQVLASKCPALQKKMIYKPILVFIYLIGLDWIWGGGVLKIRSSFLLEFYECLLHKPD
jgi:hypothetical protein